MVVLCCIMVGCLAGACDPGVPASLHQKDQVGLQTDIRTWVYSYALTARLTCWVHGGSPSAMTCTECMCVVRVCVCVHPGSRTQHVQVSHHRYSKVQGSGVLHRARFEPGFASLAAAGALHHALPPAAGRSRGCHHGAAASVICVRVPVTQCVCLPMGPGRGVLVAE